MKITKEQALKLKQVIDWLEEGKEVAIADPDYYYRLKVEFPKEIWIVYRKNGEFYETFTAFKPEVNTNLFTVIKYTISQP